ncbi:tyrosine-protein phosphatase [Kitasatospora phosalacinea]|uniref:Protein-tyrosine-phosphatase n=1 Tax=Kitasatospora phosalacinea TaxID=2065 RepID=A0A9W6PE91_9ACTN|nr:tyrosine-protein phosphatase [Kitasatospora phosalacinea]GLW53312.1 protein-tyrosine-phosphatase [Kitasatospora phosalacinea]
MTAPSTETARSLGLAAAVNARDLGGYRTADGRTVRAGALLRTEALSRLGEDDRALLGAIGLRHVVDLRSLDEVRHLGADLVPGLPAAVLPPDAAAMLTVPALDGLGPTLHHLPVFSADFDLYVELRRALGSGDPAAMHAVLGDGRGAAMMTGMYRWFVTDAVARSRFATVLRLIAEADGAPVLFHCTAGKDRTGWTAALLLTALGVDRESVLADYLLTNERAAALIARVDPLMRPLARAEAVYLEAAFEELALGWSGFEHFWQDGLGLTEEHLLRLRRACTV